MLAELARSVWAVCNVGPAAWLAGGPNGLKRDVSGNASAVEWHSMVELSQPMPASPRTVAAYLAVLRLARLRGYAITRVKMAKLLYLADLAAVRNGREPFTGVEWKFLQFGPFNNTLQYLENSLSEQHIIELTEYFNGWRVRLLDEVTGFSMQPEDLAQLEETFAQYGDLAASSLKDLSYQTAPMVDAQQRGRGVTLDLSLERPAPRLAGLAKVMAARIAALPTQHTDPGVFDDMREENASLASARGRATHNMIGDDE